MIASPGLAKRVLAISARVFPRCSMVSQAVAFNLFLAFFPTLLIAVGLATSPIGRRTNLLDLITDLTQVLPPGSKEIVSEFLINRGPEAWKWALLGWTGTLLAGSQVMRLLMEGIHLIYEDPERPGFLHRQLRSVALLLITIAPLMIAAVLGVFGRPLRHWVADEFGTSDTLRTLWAVFFHGTAMLLAMGALTVIYRVARPKECSFRNVLPGSHSALVGGRYRLWILRSASALRLGLRGFGSGDRTDDLDEFIDAHYLPGSRLQRGSATGAPLCATLGTGHRTR